ncbi:MAG: potassium-transporting ATPase potassium-binding subunit [Gaiellales bacterium]|jgi:K+-transporting ATPase ATPase A chain|nr:potassium-transporting ATPase potassium-binding subunit [Gaiellales bacterium]
MSTQGIAQIVFYAVVLTALGYPLGVYMSRIYEAEAAPGGRFLGPIERRFLRLVGVHDHEGSEQTWRAYAKTVLIFTAVFFAGLYVLLRIQGHLFLNPDGMKGVPSPLSLNTAASFVTNTNWQFYGGEATMSYLSQMAGLAVQNFISAAAGMAVLAAVIRGFARRNASTIGNFWRDLYRSLVYILLPLSIVLALVLVSQGVVQTFDGHTTATTLEGAHQTITRGPAASQIAIKQLGTNGGGFFDSNSAVPFENPNGLTNFLEMLAILLIPVGQVFMFGRMVRAMRQAWAIFAAMFVLMVAGVGIALPAEQHGSQVLRQSGVSLSQTQQSGGNMQDKEVRFGIANSALWAVATTDASNGSVNSGHDAYTPAGGAVPLVNIFFGEVIWGGVGSGLYGMFFYVIIAVFVAGLMVGRTPEYLGKKIEAREIKYAAVGALLVPTVALVTTAISVVTHGGLASIYNTGAHGFSEALYAYTSQSNNNGSAFAGYGGKTFSEQLGSVAMLLGRFAPLLAALAIGGSLAAKKTVPASAGTFRTDGPTFTVLLIGVIILTAGLMVFPALTLGPIVEALK